MKRLITVILTALFAVNAFADNCSVSDRKLEIYFSNGMSNNRKDAKASQTALKLATQSSLQSQGYTVNYDISYNENEDWYYQIVEVFKQKTAETSAWEKFWIWLTEPSDSPDWFQEALRNASREASAESYVADEDLRSHVANYKAEISDCKRLLIVAHSQGNFYANAAWDVIYSDTSADGKYRMENFTNIGLLSVATPAGRTGNYLLKVDDHLPITEHITLTNDWIINAVRGFTFFIGTLPGNYTNTVDDPDWKHHAFVDSYLNGDITGSVLTQGIQSIVGKLEVLPFNRTSVESSSLKSVGYLSGSKILEAEFVSNESIYRYYDVPQTTFDELMAADSHGSYFYANIRTNFIYKKVYDGIQPNRLLRRTANAAAEFGR